MTLDPLLLSRIQFAWVIGWHILLPAFTVGAASYIALLEGLHLATARPVYLPRLEFLDLDLRGRVRDGGGDRDRDAVPVRHQAGAACPIPQETSSARFWPMRG